jgi:hypothetical protein
VALVAALVASESPAVQDDYGFDEEAVDDYGFDEDPGDDYGFDEDTGSGEEGDASGEAEILESPLGGEDRFWDLGGDLSLGASYNYLSHNSAVGRRQPSPANPQPLGTPYGNLSRLRAQLDLQLDLRLPADWKARVEGYGFYDFAYVIRGRDQYTNDVLDDYEWEVDFREVWVQGSPTASLDLKLGRQIVNWGRSDTVRVLDVINPLDNREPGLIDIEDLRLPVTMARVDYYPGWLPDGFGDWGLQLLVIPEFRQDRNPSIGNDFNPTPVNVDPRSDKPDRFGDTPEYGAALTGTFSGWDLSFYAARVYLNQPLLAEPLSGLLQRYPFVTLAGAGGNLTTGSWLFKGEIGYFHGLEYNLADTSVAPPVRVVDKDRLDWMAGVEYYGISDLTVAFEVVHRHVFDYDDDMKAHVPVSPAPGAPTFQVAYAKEDTVESALRATADFLNSRLHVTGVALVVGTHAELGSVVRMEASYDLRDALVVTGGIVLYQEGTSPGFSEIGDNDRLFLRIEQSF